MTDDNLLKLEEFFDYLVDLSKTDQLIKLDELQFDGSISSDQKKLLKDLLKADRDTEIPDSAKSLHQIENTQESSGSETQFGNYQLIKKIGHGGMGEVYLAQRNDGLFDQTVALKKSHFLIEETFRKRFENERKILAKLTHPNIAQLLDGGTSENGQPFLVMEYVDGIPITEYCDKNDLDLNERINLVLQVCSAISFAHRSLILHRDIKPDNLLVTDDGVVKLLDFGIAKLLDDQEMNQTATQIMTRRYASPEQILGKAISTQSDVFSIGVLTYELITGSHPYSYKSQLEREQKVVSGLYTKITSKKQIEASGLSQLDNNLGGDLAIIIEKVLSVDLSRRYSSAEAFAEDLTNYINRKPISARPATTIYKIKKWTQRHLAVTVISCFSIVSLISLTILSVYQSNLAKVEKTKAQLESRKANQISEFLKSTFSSANPSASKKEVTATDLLVNGLETVDETLDNDPEIKFEMIALFTNIFVNLSNYELAEKIFNEHYSICNESLSVENIHCINLLTTSARVAHNMEKPDVAVQTYKKAIELAKSQTPQNKQLIGGIYRNMFSSLVNIQKVDEALSTTARGIELLSEAGMSYSSRVSAYNDLAYAAISYRKFDEAEKYLSMLEPIIIENTPLDYLDLAKLANMRGYSLLIQKKYLQAAQFREKAVNILDENFEKPFETSALIKYTLARTWYHQGNHVKAIERGKHALKAYQSLDDNNHPRIGNVLLFLSVLNFETGDIESANSYLEQVDTTNLRDRLCDLTRARAFKYIDEKRFSQAEENIQEYQVCSKNVRVNVSIQVYYPVLKFMLAFEKGDIASARKYAEEAKQFWEKQPLEYPILKRNFSQLISEFDESISIK